jgi:hypothetical protein
VAKGDAKIASSRPVAPIAGDATNIVRVFAERFRCSEHDVREAMEVVGTGTDQIREFVKAKQRRARRNEAP